jgi:tetratricopeptide (TPR) repeat protein
MPGFHRNLLRLASAALFTAALASSSLADATPHKWPAPTGEVTDTSIAEARARFSAGNRAVEAGRWADALADFERSYALSGVPSALFNLATTLRALGRHVDARDAFDQLLTSHPDQAPAERDRAKQLRQEEQARIATLVLLDLPPGDATVTIDGKRADDSGARPFQMEVDPTTHEIRVEQPKMKAFVWRGEFADAD